MAVRSFLGLVLLLVFGAASFSDQLVPLELWRDDGRPFIASAGRGEIGGISADAKKNGSSFFFAGFDKWFSNDPGGYLPGYLIWVLLLFAGAMLGYLPGRFLVRSEEKNRTGALLEHTRKLEQEISEHENSQRQLYQLAYYDEITSLPNRLFFNERLHASLMDEKAVIGVAVADLDRFKNFNDTLGHEAGNALLRLVAKRISDSLPDDILLARYGGDEFALMIVGESPQQCVATIKGVECALQDPITELGSELYVSASFGLSHFPAQAGNISELLQQADIAMYLAKEEGGGTHCLYDAEIGKRVISREELETSLRGALVGGEMWLEYQPQVDLVSNRVLAVEALLRWRHPERGIIDTAEFIQVAEETGQIISIGEWVMEEVFAQAAQWREQGIKPFKIAVNLSSKQVQKKSFVSFVRQLIDEYDFPPDHLELEITEHVLIDYERETLKTMGELKSLGMSLAIDDFGTGYSALSYLHRFPIDTLKIDQSFVANLHSDDNNKAITSAIVAMAQRLNLRTVAECVEKDEQVKILCEMQCHAAQGFYFTEPLTQDKLAQWMGSEQQQKSTKTAS